MNVYGRAFALLELEQVNTLSNEVKKYFTAISLALIAVGLFLYTIISHWQ